MRRSTPTPKTGRTEFTSRAGLVIAIATAVTIAVLLLWYAASVLLLLFAGVLLSIVLRAAADEVARVTPLPPGWSVALITLLLTTAIGVILWFYGPQIVDGIYELVYGLPKALAAVETQLDRYEWGRRLVEVFRGIQWDSVAPEIVQRAVGVFSAVIPAIGSLLVILFLGLYLSAEPRTYTQGLIRLVPVAKRKRAAEVLRRLGYVLRRLLLGRALSMVILFGLTWGGLLLLGVPYAFSLAVLAGLFELVPNVGPIIAALPAIIVAFSQSPLLAAAVIGLYLVLQTIESYLITPLIQREMSAIPPALLFTVQLMMGLLFGILGLLLAEAMTAVLMVLVRMLYIEDVLENEERL